MKKIIIAITICIITSCTNTKLTQVTLDSPKLIELPDGSTAFLNENSSIEYIETFENRTIKQKGEVFYIVKSNKVPFIVETANGNIEVLGTEFNVKSIGQEIEVEVEKGLVKLKAKKIVKNIKKGQKAVFKDIKNGIEIGKAEFKHQKWVKNLKNKTKKVGKEVKKETKKIEKEFKKIGKEVGKKFNN